MLSRDEGPVREFIYRGKKSATYRRCYTGVIHDGLPLSSRVENDELFLTYVNKRYFSFLKDKLESRDETYEYSQFKIEQIFKGIEKFISVDEMCDMYWKRLVAIVEGKDYSGNRLWNCIDAYRDWFQPSLPATKSHSSTEHHQHGGFHALIAQAPAECSLEIVGLDLLLVNGLHWQH